MSKQSPPKRPSFNDLLATSAKPPEKRAPLVWPATNPLDTSDVPRDVPTVPRIPYESLGIPRDVPAVPSVPRDSREQRTAGRSERSRERLKQAQLNVSVRADVIDELRSYARLTRRSVADVVEQFVVEGLGRAAAAIPTLPSVPRDLSNLMIDDIELNSTVNIISHQALELLEKPLSPEDVEEAREFVRQLDKPLTKAAVRAGFALTLLRTKQTRINSLSYYLREVRNQLDADSNYADWTVMKARREGKIR